MIILALDPSSMCTGYAVLTGLDPEDLVDAGLITPTSKWTATPNAPEAIQKHLQSNDLGAYRRIQSMIPDILDLLREHDPNRIVVEWPSGLVGTGARHGAKGSLTTYGAAVGLILGACMSLAPEAVVPVTERQWTAHQASKVNRQAAIALTYRRRYKLEDDPGADAADAIMLARWWLREREEPE